MKIITVKASSTYDIMIDRGILNNCGALIKQNTGAKKLAVVTDSVVNEIYADTVMQSLEREGFEAVKFVFPNGEASKSAGVLNDIYEFLALNNITRTDCLVALGGGVVGDITGYAAATYLRGVEFVQIPTTLLAQIDSSVGGKTAINLPCGKNLVGAFKQPDCVICDIDTLKTLSPEILSDGMAEAIKYGMIKDKELFDIIGSHTIDNVSEVIDEIIYRSVLIKRDIVEADEFDRGERMLLNFGHTLGHAVESYYKYSRYTHGSAVALGMYAFTERLNGKGDLLDSLESCLKAYNLPTEIEVGVDKLVPLCYNDKKRESDKINIVLCKEKGKAYTEKLSIAEFNAFMGV